MKCVVVFATLALTSMTVGFLAYGFQDTPEGKATNVEMTDAHAFQPKEVTVNVGDTVVWKNNSRHIHTVSTDPREMKTKEGKDWAIMPEGVKPFHSGKITVGMTFQHTFTTPGTYRYVCTLHEDKGMMGTVTVKSKE